MEKREDSQNLIEKLISEKSENEKYIRERDKEYINVENYAHNLEEQIKNKDKTLLEAEKYCRKLEEDLKEKNAAYTKLEEYTHKIQTDYTQKCKAYDDVENYTKACEKSISEMSKKIDEIEKKSIEDNEKIEKLEDELQAKTDAHEMLFTQYTDMKEDYELITNSTVYLMLEKKIRKSKTRVNKKDSHKER